MKSCIDRYGGNLRSGQPPFWPAHLLAVAVLFPTIAKAAEPATGYQPSVAVREASPIDWVFTVANQSPAKPPAGWDEGYDAAKQSFERFAPDDYDAKQAHPLIVFISPGGKATGFRHFEHACRTRGILFAGPHAAGNNVQPQRRVRIVLDVLAQMRKDYRVDVDRTYLAGFSGGGRVACTIAFALPEYFGGVIPICAGGELRDEPWLRHRVIDRLSLAHVTGETDFNRGEVERMRHPLLSEVGVRSRLWVVPKMGHSVPRGPLLAEVIAWLDDAADERAALAKEFPASRAAPDTIVSREEAAKALLAEGKLRIAADATRYSGLMQLKGLFIRWHDLPEAREARGILLKYEDQPNAAWKQADIAQQRRYLIARAKAVDAYASGPLSKQYEAMRPNMAKAALQLWGMVIQDGQNAKAVEQAKQRIPVLEKLASGSHEESAKD